MLYFSIHRYDETNYWPHKKEANYDVVGKRDGEGKTIHVAWNKAGISPPLLFLGVTYEICSFLSKEMGYMMINIGSALFLDNICQYLTNPISILLSNINININTL